MSDSPDIQTHGLHRGIPTKLSLVETQNDVCRFPQPHSLRRTHVLFLVDQLAELGGGERALMQIVREISPRFHCSVITFRPFLHPNIKALLPVPVVVIPLTRTYNFGAIKSAFMLRRYIDYNSVDIVHTFFETADIWGGIVTRLSRAKVLISSRRDMALLRTKKHDLAYRFVGRMSDCVLTVSDAVRELVIRKDGLDARRVITLYTGVGLPHSSDKNTLLHLRCQMGVPPDAPIVLSVANILPWKGHSDFLQAAALVHSICPSAHFVVAGASSDGALAAELLCKRSSLGLDKCFHYIGSIASTWPLYQIASVSCLLSTTEGMPNAVLEAMSSGCPVVATNVGGTGEAVVDGLTGFLVSPGNVGDAAARISQLLTSSHLACSMSAASIRQVAEHFDLRQMIARLEDIYDSTLRRKSL